MRIVVDTDACPKGVKAICEEVSERKGLPLVLVSDYDHDLVDEEPVALNVDGDKGAGDYKIFSIVEPTDIVVSHDHGLASLLYTEVTAIIHPEGFIYNAANIDELLYRRYLGRKLREDGRAERIKKRTSADDEAFQVVLESITETF